MFRAYSYLTLDDGGIHRLNGPEVETYEQADAIFTGMVEKLNNGGGIEQHVPGIGWVLADDVETAQIIARRREPV